MVSRIRFFFDHPVSFYFRNSNRYLYHLQLALLFAVPSYLLVVYADRPLVFKIIYPSVMILCFCGVYFILSEWLVRTLGVGKDSSSLKVKKLFNIALVSYGLGYLPYRIAEYNLVPYYYSDASLDKIDGEFVLFFRMLPFWLFSFFVVTWHWLRKQKINKKADTGQGNNSIQPALNLDKPYRIDPNRITHVSVEEHYCRIYYSKEEGIDHLQVRSSLQSIINQLPKEAFIQIHRSHIVNLSFITEIKKLKSSYQVSVFNGQFFLPISRHRTREIFPKIRQYLEESDANRIVVPKSLYQ